VRKRFEVFFFCTFGPILTPGSRRVGQAEDMGQTMSAAAGCCDKRDEDFKRKRSQQGGRDGAFFLPPFEQSVRHP
jgi:hypothetical protein